jgi:hypothetical protein
MSPRDYLAFLDAARRLFGASRRKSEPITDCRL